VYNPAAPAPTTATGVSGVGKVDTVPAMAAAPAFLHDPSSLEHDTGPHPERAARIVAIERELDARDWLGWEQLLSPRVELATLTAVHPEPYVYAIEQASAAGGADLDPDTVVSSGSYEAALHAAGGAVQLVDLLLDGAAPTGFSVHRPPGHHALPSRAMGFCLFNNAAVAARHAIDARGVERVLIVDWDVHHGNGTNDIFHSDPMVLYASIHQYPMYPGTGSARDTGSGAGEGFTLNMPVPYGSGDREFCSLVDDVVVPRARSYEPQLVLLSAGYDAHRDDPLAGCEMTEAGYARMTESIRSLCDHLGVPVGAILEGGYDVDALARSVVATMEALAA
jgi:acetoin utilization deacetylase AcuC-like enzyme